MLIHFQDDAVNLLFGITEELLIPRSKEIHKCIMYIFAGREVRIGKNCTRGLQCRSRAVLETNGMYVFLNTDRPRSANKVYIFSLRFL